MQVFKFGGASLQDAAGIKNVATIIKQHQDKNLVIVCSAMGKTTNALEALVDSFCHKKHTKTAILNELKQYHLAILEQLFPNKNHTVYIAIHQIFSNLELIVAAEPRHSYNYEYDEIVSSGEFISSTIVSAYLNELNSINTYCDARTLIQTDTTYRDANINWARTEAQIKAILIPYFNTNSDTKAETKMIVTQGFIGATPEKNTSTLGREGSDYSAAIIAFALNAESITIWKDVAGVLNADPKWFDTTSKLEQLSYQDAIELAYYGATIIHPKTIKPLENKKIPLYVKSFLNPTASGTKISEQQTPLPIPCFIFKINQILISISPKDFSFIAADNLSFIFNLFATHQVKINVIQNSAISFSVSADNEALKIKNVMELLQQKFRVRYNENLELITIRYYNQATIDRVCLGKNILLEQRSRYTAQLVVEKSVNENN